MSLTLSLSHCLLSDAGVALGQNNAEVGHVTLHASHQEAQADGPPAGDGIPALGGSWLPGLCTVSVMFPL